MTKRLLACLLGLSTVVGSAHAAVSYADLAFHYAPVHYQDTDSSDYPSGPPVRLLLWRRDLQSAVHQQPLLERPARCRVDFVEPTSRLPVAIGSQYPLREAGQLLYSVGY
jgi:hypothetical protein